MYKRSKLSKRRSKKNKLSKRRSKLSKRSKMSPLKKFCRTKLSNKIKINMREYKNKSKKIKSPLQAIAIAYSQIKKKYPKCSRSLKKK